MNLEEWLEKPAEQFNQFWYRNRLTILMTIVINLILLIALLTLQITSVPRFVDRTLLIGIEPEPENPEETTAMMTNHSDWGEEMAPTKVRNITVDASQIDPLNAGLSDEKQINAQELYEEAARVRGEMQTNREHFEQANPFGEIEIPNTPQKKIELSDKTYTGPSVASYFLQNRKAYNLPVPSYKCKVGGPVVVDITVDRSGRVVGAEIDAANSKSDPCLWETALVAARRSLFNASPNAENRQKGSITYMFVAQ